MFFLGWIVKGCLSTCKAHIRHYVQVPSYLEKSQSKTSVPHENPVNSTLQREKRSQVAAQKPWVVFTFENQEHPLKKKNNEISHSDTVQKEECNNGPKMLFPIVVVLG